MTGVEIVLQVLLAGSCVLQLMMLMGAQQGRGIDMVTAQANDLRQQIVSFLVVGGALICFVALLVWIYAAHANLPALGARKLEFTPGWAVGYFFIPILNLWKPYQAVHEIYYCSDPRPVLGRAASSAAIVGWWWGLRIISAIASRALATGAGPTNTIEGLITISGIAIFVIAVIDLPMLTTQFFMIRQSQRFQDDRYALLQQQIRAEPAASSPWTAFS